MKAQTFRQFIEEHDIKPADMARAMNLTKQEINRFITNGYLVIDGKHLYSKRKHEIDLSKLLK